MTPSPYDCVVVEAHRDSFGIVRQRLEGQVHPVAESLLPRYLKGGYDVVVFIVGGDSVTHRDMSDRPLQGSLDVLDFFINECQACDGKASIIKYEEDVPTKPDKNHVCFLMELEGGRPFQEDYSSGRKMHGKLATLRTFYRLGVRSAQLTHNGRNELADGMFDARTKGGLSEFGVAVVREMNRLHMMIGVSHLTDECFFDVLENSSDPVFASHCNARAIFDHPRNLTEEQLKALAKNGGVVGIHLLTMMLCKGRKATLDDFLQHIDYVAELIGPQHIGFGLLDFDDPAAPLIPLMEELDKRGYSREDAHGIVGGNCARLMRQVLPSRGEDTIW